MLSPVHCLQQEDLAMAVEAVDTRDKLGIMLWVRFMSSIFFVSTCASQSELHSTCDASHCFRCSPFLYMYISFFLSLSFSLSYPSSSSIRYQLPFRSQNGLYQPVELPTEYIYYLVKSTDLWAAGGRVELTSVGTSTLMRHTLG